MRDSWRKSIVRSAAVGLILAAALSGAKAQTINCTGPTGGNCVPVVQIAPPAGIGAGSGNAGYPAGATPITATGSGTTAATTATLAAAAGKFTYICGFSITATATTGLASTATVATVVGGNTLTFGQAVGTAPAVASTLENFSDCIPTNAVNTGITVTSAAAGTAGVTNVSAWGYQQ